MGFQVSPGINVSEIDLTTVVPAVSTVVGAIAGHFRWGPVDQRVVVSSEDVLVDNFQTPNANTANDFFTAKNFLAYTNQLQTVRVVNQSDDDGAFNAVANTDGTEVANTTLLVKNEDDYEENFAGGQTRAGIFYAKYPGELGNSLKVSVCASNAAYESTISANLLFSASNTSVFTVGDKTDPTLSGANTSDWTPIDISSQIVTGDRIVFQINTANTHTANTSSADDGLGLSNIVNFNGKVAAVNASSITLTTTPTISQLGSEAATTFVRAAGNAKRRWEYFDSVDGAPGTSAYALAAGGQNDELHVVIVDEDGEIAGVQDNVIEAFSKLSKARDAKSPTGNNIYYKDVINLQSRYVYWNKHGTISAQAGNLAAGTTFAGASLPINGHFINGKDGALPRNADYINGYNLFQDEDEVNVSFLLGAAANQTRAIHLINNIAEVRKDCLAVLSPERADVVNNNLYAGKETEDIIAFRNSLPSTSFAVLDSGWKYQYDKYNDVYRYVPLNGDIAGLMARTESERDAWFSPAGFTRGNIKSVIKLAFNPKKTDRDLLYQSGVNPVVSFTGQGTVLFGDKTLLANPSAFDRINVRRLFIVLEKAIKKASESSLFEFNDEFTRLQFRNLVEPFLRDVQGRRGITDFLVVCDSTNNTPEVIDRNEFIGDIYIKPNRSINFIQLNFVAVRSGVDFSEVVGAF